MEMGEKDDGLGLSLSLKCYDPRQISPPSLQLNLSRSSTPFMDRGGGGSNGSDSGHENSIIKRELQLSAVDRSSNINKIKRTSNLGGTDVNRAIVVELDEEIKASSPNSTLSSVSGKKSERDIIVGEEDGGGGGSRGGGERKKLRLTKEQSAELERTFRQHTTLNTKQKMVLAKHLNLKPRQVEVWFQNRRARTKLKQTEVDCEYLKKCCERLTEENRRLEKEAQELRARKLSSDFYNHMKHPTTLIMCTSCERISVSSASSASAAGVLCQPAPITVKAPTPIRLRELT